MQALIYARISKDREGAGLGVDRQRSDCEGLAESLGWTVVDTLTDNDISAYSGKRRPGYEALLDALREGRANAVLAWHTDRLHRSLVELEAFIEICQRHDVTVRTVRSGPLDLSTPSGQMTARIMGAVARHEVDHARQRVKTAHRQAAVNGRAHGKIPFGYQAVRDRAGKIVERVPHPVEAPLVREAVDRVLAGESVRAVWTSWNERGIPTPRGKQWGPQMMRDVLLRPVYAGLRVHRGELYPGSWEPLITREQHEKVVALLSDSTRIMHRGTEAKYLLTGIARCGVCGEYMWRLKSHGYDALTCLKNHCTSRKMELVDGMVEEAILRWCESVSSVDELADPEAAAALVEARRLRAKLDRAIELVDDDKLSPESLAKLEQRLLPKIRRLEKSAQRTPHPHVLELLGPNARPHWAKMDIADRRAVVRSLVTVTINPTRSGYRFDPSAIRVEWR